MCEIRRKRKAHKFIIQSFLFRYAYSCLLYGVWCWILQRNVEKLIITNTVRKVKKKEPKKTFLLFGGLVNECVLSFCWFLLYIEISFFFHFVLFVFLWATIEDIKGFIFMEGKIVISKKKYNMTIQVGWVHDKEF